MERLLADSIASLSHTAQRKALGKIIDSALQKSPEKREQSILKILDVVQHFLPDELTEEKMDSARKVLQDPSNKWIRMIQRALDETDPHVAKVTLLNLGYEAFLRGTKTIRENRELHRCNIPWLILFDPTSACNMHCAGCWAGTYGNRHNLSYADMDRLVTEGKALGVYFYMLTGGEPLVRKADILKLAEKHNDVQFAIYTNSTLIDEAFCREVQRLGNLIFLLSIEGTPETNDGRRGDGHYEAVMSAMDLLREHGILFGTSICYTSQNVEAVTSDEFFRVITERGARFGFYFHYMPTGNAAVPELLPSPEQRKYMIDRIHEIRSESCEIEFFPMDFQNDGEYVGGCIAGGRNYFHINSAGDAEPCVFIHYSNVNFHNASLLEILKSPLFMAYYHGQPFNHNHLRPCPMLENPEILERLVQESGAHSTDLESPESAEHLTAKTRAYAENWAGEAEVLWEEHPHKKPAYSNYAKQ